MSEQKQHAAAAYARMSTDMQNYSIRHQTAVIALFAQQNGIDIVREYTDEGRSGLTIEGRPALRQMLAEILSGHAPYRTVLVYDVSRWGRFQDIDESAHYEFMCRQAGVTVLYVAEAFANDGTPMASMIKGLKRLMAAEYSRELSAKVLNAQCSFARLGYKAHGGDAGYGLRRVCAAADGTFKRILAPGERKPALTDRVKFALGPEQEVAVVKETYRLYLEDGLGDTAIAAHWNARGIKNQFGECWDPYNVRRILTSEKYTGAIVYNRSSTQLNSRRLLNPEEQWVRVLDAHPQIVPRAVFDAAQMERKRRLKMPAKDAITMRLKALHERTGKVNAALIKADSRLPGPQFIRSVFGSLAAAYAAADIAPARTARSALTKAATFALLDQLVPQVEDLIRDAGAASERLGRGMLRINGGVRLRIAVSCCRHEEHARRWKVTLRSQRPYDFVLCARLNIANDAIASYYLFPVSQFVQRSIWFNTANAPEHESCRYRSLNAIFGIDD
ncbi:recombinase family protein [Pseudoduganella sp. SL102]|uniref:recombinase family protein n=1 Tax=Pseudoduganella sp. SL102 TaxID=2995154 RepID=UPI00248C2FC3|nr:recombinase family protein [Pseudoduganella sp. SL102]WBS00170.1 recombinase family protein [Pseudoduganella sp. SL102]